MASLAAAPSAFVMTPALIHCDWAKEAEKFACSKSI